MKKKTNVRRVKIKAFAVMWDENNLLAQYVKFPASEGFIGFVEAPAATIFFHEKDARRFLRGSSLNTDWSHMGGKIVIPCEIYYTLNPKR